MNVLVADDDPITARRLEATLREWGYDVIVATDGTQASEILMANSTSLIAILDWSMPGRSGIDICRQIREERGGRSVHIILLTAKARMEDLVEGLGAGADDYLKKPFDVAELRARVEVGLRSVGLQDELRTRLTQLEEAMADVKMLRGLLPICSYCKKVRDDGNYWHQVESYFTDHSAVTFSHGVCPDCLETVVRPQLERLR